MATFNQTPQKIKHIWDKQTQIEIDTNKLGKLINKPPNTNNKNIRIKKAYTSGLTGKVSTIFFYTQQLSRSSNLNISIEYDGGYNLATLQGDYKIYNPR